MSRGCKCRGVATEPKCFAWEKVNLRKGRGDLEPRRLGSGEAVHGRRKTPRRQKSGGISRSCSQSKSSPLKSSIKSILLRCFLGQVESFRGRPRGAKSCLLGGEGTGKSEPQPRLGYSRERVRTFNHRAKWVSGEVMVSLCSTSRGICHGAPAQGILAERLSWLLHPSSRTGLLGFGEGLPNIYGAQLPSSSCPPHPRRSWRCPSWPCSQWSPCSPFPDIGADWVSAWPRCSKLAWLSFHSIRLARSQASSFARDAWWESRFPAHIYISTGILKALKARDWGSS